MGDREDIKAFKGLLREYVTYEARKEDIKARMSDVWYELSGVKGVRYDRIPARGKHEDLPDWKVRLYDEITALRKELNRLNLNHEYVEYILNDMDPETADAIVEIYAYGRSYEQVARENGISVGGLQKRIAKELKRIYVFRNHKLD